MLFVVIYDQFYVIKYYQQNTNTRLANELTIEGFHVMSYQANFASHHIRDRHVDFLSTQSGIGKNKKMFHFFFI